MGIKIDDLNSLGADLFNDSESLMDNIRSLSEDELNISGGGHYSYYSYGYDGKGGFSNVINVNFVQPVAQPVPVAQPTFVAQPVPVAQPVFGGGFFYGYSSS